MKIALVHDYIKEYGGAERVLKVLTEMYPEAPIYTAFCVKGSTADKEFQDREIVESWLAPLLKIGKLYSPLRFLTPLIWKTMDLTNYDLVLTSSSWYITRGFKVSPKTKVICYCHTPPRWLYGYETSVNYQKYWLVKIYAVVVGHFMRMYDWNVSQKIKYWIANSKNVQARIKKFYRKDSTVIYPPVDVEKIVKFTTSLYSSVVNYKNNYFLIVSRLVGAKGLEEAIRAFSKLGDKYKLKIVGEGVGLTNVKCQMSKVKWSNIEFLGRVDDKELYKLYAKARGFIALAKDEDFGITVVEAQAAGTPVIAFSGGGFKESIIDGVTGILINETDGKTISEAIRRFEKIKWDKEKLQTQAKKFSKERFIADLGRYISSKL
jgi:glycosyltransferase involved in cell wall biosynthesis